MLKLKLWPWYLKAKFINFFAAFRPWLFLYFAIVTATLTAWMIMPLLMALSMRGII